MSAEVTRVGLVTMQVCVPSDWTEAQAEQFANEAQPTGISSRWTICEQGNDCLGGADSIVKCEQREGHVHRVLSC